MLPQIQQNEIIIEHIGTDDDQYVLVFNESVDYYAMREPNPQKAKETLKAFLKKHPFLYGAAIRTGLDALATYQRNKNITARFFAQTPYERMLYKHMSKKLVDSGDYKLVKIKYLNGGIMYELVKVD